MFLIFESQAAIPSRLASQRRARPSSCNGDNYSSESAGVPPVGCRALSARTRRRRRCSPEHALRLDFPVTSSHPLAPRYMDSSAQNCPSFTPQTCSLRAQPACCTRPASSCVTCTVPRAASTSIKIAVDLSFFLCFGGSGTSAHTKDKHTHLITSRTPLAGCYIRLRTPLLTESDRPSWDLHELRALCWDPPFWRRGSRWGSFVLMLLREDRWRLAQMSFSSLDETSWDY